MIPVAENIKRMRLGAGLSQEQLAGRLGVTRSTVSQWETGWSQPRMGLLAKLAAELGVSPEDIVSEEGHSAGAPHHNHNLKAIRRAAGVTQQQLADKAEIPLKTIQDWEQTGRSPRDMQRLVPIAEALGCTVDELLGRTTRGDRLDALEDRLDALEARLAAVEGRTDGTGDAPNAPATDQEIVARIRGILSGGAS